MGEHELEEIMLYMVLISPTVLFASTVMIALYFAI
jgi:hypothetical protein